MSALLPDEEKLIDWLKVLESNEIQIILKMINEVLYISYITSIN